MDMDTINDDIFAFSDKFFAESFEIIDNNFNFMDKHEFIEPKENYFSILKYLHTTMHHFDNLDHEFASSTLHKLTRDTENIEKLYLKRKKQLETIQELFDTRFIKKVPMFMDMVNEIRSIKENPSADDYDKKNISIIKKQYVQIKQIYFENFKEDFVEQTNEILSSLKVILNSKAYYLDNLLWIDANQSEHITRVLKAVHHTEKINSKKYLSHRLEVDLPYTDDYKYLQQCLKVYT